LTSGLVYAPQGSHESSDPLALWSSWCF